MLVDKYLNAIKDQRIDLIEYVDLEDVGTSPSEENLAIAKKYGVTATPVLVVTDSEGNKLEEYIGGMGITQNIRKLFDQYAESESTL
jgi:thioredoxin-related protein